jgi:putative transposase
VDLPSRDSVRAVVTADHPVTATIRADLIAREAHYNGRRPHRSRHLHPPRPDDPVADLTQKQIKRRPVLGGLINEYERAA